ncbi:hypothetical protein D3C80_2029030 [compost metagenome]
MPVDTTHIPVTIDFEKQYFYQPLNDETLFPYFSDVIPFINQTFIFSPAILSVGDLVILLGCFFIGYFINQNSKESNC